MRASLSTVQHARHVVMIGRGTVVDAGGHDVLLRRWPPYREPVASQAVAALRARGRG